MIIKKAKETFYDMTDCGDMSVGLPIYPHFERFTSAEMYERAGLKG